MEPDYSKAVHRAASQGLITLDRYESLACHDCGYVDMEAFAIGACPNCGSARTRNVRPSTD